MSQVFLRNTTSFFVVKEGRGQDNKGPELTILRRVFVYMLPNCNCLICQFPAIP